MLTNIQQQMKQLQEQIINTDYYPEIYYNCLCAKHVKSDMIALGVLSDSKIVEIANDFWLALPDSPAIRRAPFFLLCELCEASPSDIAEHVFEED